MEISFHFDMNSKSNSVICNVIQDENLQYQCSIYNLVRINQFSTIITFWPLLHLVDSMSSKWLDLTWEHSLIKDNLQCSFFTQSSHCVSGGGNMHMETMWNYRQSVRIEIVLWTRGKSCSTPSGFTFGLRRFINVGSWYRERAAEPLFCVWWWFVCHWCLVFSLLSRLRLNWSS